MQPLTRLAFSLYGIVLAASKIALDWLLLAYFGLNWTWNFYYTPLPFNLLALTPGNRNLLLALAALALPYTLAGVWLCLRRLKTLGHPLWLVVLFFLPGLNLLFFCYLALALPRPAQNTRGSYQGFASLSSAWAAATISAAVALAAIALSVLGFRSYGWGVFLAIPFTIGLISTLLYSFSGPRSFASCFGVSCTGMVIVATAMLSFAMEGVICLLMSVPLALPLAAAGVAVGRCMVNPDPGVQPTAMTLAISLIASCPLAATLNAPLSISGPLHQVVTSIEIDAPPEQVWQHVISFPDLAPPQAWFFRAGIAYPLRARIEGSGVGAIRYCEFSTGPFVEPITRWEPGRLLAFNVVSSPPPLRELSPYDIHPPHLNGFLNSRRGQFLLTALPSGRTRLEGTTWYELRLLPESYWALWADFFIHQIHKRVLEHIALNSTQHASLLGLN